MGQAITTMFWWLLGRGEAGKSLLSADHRRDGDGDECTGSVWLIGRAPANPPSDPVSCYYPFDYTPGAPGGDDDDEDDDDHDDDDDDDDDHDDDDNDEYNVMIGSSQYHHLLDIGEQRVPYKVLVDGDQEEADSTGCGNFGTHIHDVSIIPGVSIRFVFVDVTRADGVIVNSLQSAAPLTPPPRPPMSSSRGRGALGPYSWEQKILLVGEGDFSFSASLAVAFGDASNIISTSLDSFEFLMKNYKRAVSNIFELTSKGCKVMHGVDATKMANKPQFRSLKFDCIVYNFPHAGFAYLKAPRDAQISKHQALVRGFLANAKKMIKDNGQIHITHKCVGFSRDWNLEMLGTTEGLRLVEEAPFNYRDYPGYNTKYGYGGDRNFDCCPSKRYKFQLVTSPPPPKKKRTRRKQKN